MEAILDTGGAKTKVSWDLTQNLKWEVEPLLRRNNLVAWPIGISFAPESVFNVQNIKVVEYIDPLNKIGYILWGSMG